MIIGLKIPDETYEVYGRRNPESPRVEIERTLQAFASLDPREVSLFLNREELKELNTILGHPISSVKELFEHLKRSQRVSLGEGIEVELTSAQRARLAADAEFWKEDFKTYVAKHIKLGVVNVVGP
jgi:hypothetical protein